MAFVEIDRQRDGAIAVSWLQGAQPLKTRMFTSRNEAESFAYAKMGRKGSVSSTLDMSSEQMAAHEARKARAARLMASFAEGRAA